LDRFTSFNGAETPLWTPILLMPKPAVKRCRVQEKQAAGRDLSSARIAEIELARVNIMSINFASIGDHQAICSKAIPSPLLGPSASCLPNRDECGRCAARDIAHGLARPDPSAWR
jgi:hypothetical protein